MVLAMLLFTGMAFANTGSSAVADHEGIYSFSEFLRLLGSLGLFLFGMKFMSEGVQKAAGNKLRKILKAVTSNKVLGIITGVAVTSLVQSSSATTVMVVSFTNAGLFSLAEAVSVIMGANIGTTVTGWIVAAVGKFEVSDFALPVLGIAFPFLFMANEQLKNWAEFVIGFALLFFGLGELKDSIPNINDHPEVLEFVSGWSSMGFASLLLFIGVGTVLTIVVQSSSASMAITIALLSEGWIDFPTGAAMILGENIGTTITAQLAALIANINAKRAAMAHTMFNVVGVLWMLVLFRPFLHMVQWLMVATSSLYCNVFGQGCDIDPQTIDIFSSDAEMLTTLGPVGLAVFHTTFNVANVLLLVWFSGLLVKGVKLIVPGKGQKKSDVLKYLDSGLMATPELAVIEAQKEVYEFGQLTHKMFKTNLVLLFRSDERKLPKASKKILAFEDECDEKEREIARFLADLSMNNLSKATALKVRQIWSIINDLERIGDLNEKIMLSLGKRDDIPEFNEQTLQAIKTLTDKVDDGFEMMLNILDREEQTKYSLDQVRHMELSVNEIRDTLRNAFFIEIENEAISFQTGLLAMEVVSNLEKIADHIYGINLDMLDIN
ncbi:MAG: Na/Pi cotransporter family protein [Bacteroidetes bacterium]|nr:Na/Pi cotransporter family protein [Bacteroidota bacterium]